MDIFLLCSWFCIRKCKNLASSLYWHLILLLWLQLIAMSRSHRGNKDNMTMRIPSTLHLICNRWAMELQAQIVAWACSNTKHLPRSICKTVLNGYDVNEPGEFPLSGPFREGLGKNYNKAPQFSDLWQNSIMLRHHCSHLLDTIGPIGMSCHFFSLLLARGHLLTYRTSGGVSGALFLLSNTLGSSWLILAHLGSRTCWQWKIMENPSTFFHVLSMFPIFCIILQLHVWWFPD